MVDSSPSPYINRCEGRQLNYACHDATSNYMCHTYAVAVAGTNTAACGGLPDKVLHSSNRWHCRAVFCYSLVLIVKTQYQFVRQANI